MGTADVGVPQVAGLPDPPAVLLVDFWLSLSQSSLNVFQPPSLATMLQYALLVTSFLAGHLTIKHLIKVVPMRRAPKPPVFRAGTARMKLVLTVSAVGSGLLLLISLKLSGAYSTNFVDYFLSLRVESATVEDLTGNHYLDVLTKVVVFPLSYTIILVILANEARWFKSVLIVCICNLLAYSYLWQVNYPLIHLFWILAFYLLLVNSRRSHFNIKTLLVVSTLFATLLISAANRFGGDVLGGFQRYVVGYHLLGFRSMTTNTMIPTAFFTHTVTGARPLGSWIRCSKLPRSLSE